MEAIVALLSDPQVWIAFFTLTALELVLGIDNIIFISILVDKLERVQREKARRIGLFLAMFMRIGLLMVLSWIVGLTAPLFTITGTEISGRDLILIAGGVFLVWKSTMEIHQLTEGEEGHASKSVKASFAAIIVQIIIIDMVFSLDSIITAVGLVDELVGHDRRGNRLGRPHDAVRARHRRFRLGASVHQDAGAVVPAAGGRHARRRRVRSQGAEGLHLLRDGVLGGGGDAQHPHAQEENRRPSSCTNPTRRAQPWFSHCCVSRPSSGSSASSCSRWSPLSSYLYSTEAEPERTRRVQTRVRMALMWPIALMSSAGRARLRRG